MSLKILMISRLILLTLLTLHPAILMIFQTQIIYILTISQIYLSELQLNKANTSGTEEPFLDLHLSISNDIVSTKMLVSMIRKYHNHTPQADPRHREKKPQNINTNKT